MTDVLTSYIGSRLGSHSMTGVRFEREHADTDPHAGGGGGRPREEGCRDGSDVAMIRGTPRAAGARGWERLGTEPSGGERPRWHLGLRLPASRTVTEYVPIVLSPTVWHFVTAATGN